jgi:NNP family nitrate/nitrite transporter-like MFS transporter
MKLGEFVRAGHLPTLVSAFLYFGISFMVWILIGALANSIMPEFGLSDSQKGLLVAVPLLGGALLRVVVGLVADQIGARRTAILGMVLTMLPLVLGWLWADQFDRLLVVGLLLGVAGASFAAALPLASRWYPSHYQGLVMGIVGAGSSGTALSTFFGPRLAQVWGWHAVFGLALVPLLTTLGLFMLLARDSPNQPAPRPLSQYVTLFAKSDTWWFCAFYSITFGGFVGLASFLSVYFHSQYGVSQVQAGNVTTICVISGSLLRPLGGYLSDRMGGARILSTLYLAMGALVLYLALMPPVGSAVLVLFLVMALLGMGNGAVFQLVPSCFPDQLGIATGVIGAAGGMGGFVLPNLLGSVREMTGSYSGGLVAFALVGGFGGAAALAYASRGWQNSLLESRNTLALETA